MVPPTEEALAARRAGYRRRTPIAVMTFVFMVASVVLPHVMVTAAANFLPGRSLISVSAFFLKATPGGEAFAGGTSAGAVGFGLTVTYLGLALQQMGVLVGIGTFWVLAVEDVGRWIRRFAMAAGVLLTLGSATCVLGSQQLEVANIPTLLGIAWLPTLGAGITLIVGARLARRRVVSTWFLDSPELVQP